MFNIYIYKVTDNESAFTIKKFETFIQQNGVRQIRIAPSHLASNDQAVRAIKILKKQ